MTCCEPAAASGRETETFGDILRGTRSLIPTALIDGAGWKRVLACAGDMPADAARTFGFELRLGDPAPAADLCLFIRPHSAIERYFIRRGEAAGSGSPDAALARRLIAAREEPDRGPPWRTILEYDLVDPLPVGDRVSGIYLVRPAFDAEGLAADAASGEDPQRLAVETARSAGWAEDKSEQRALKRLSDALPPDGGIVITGAFPGRAVRALRVLIGGVAEDGLPDFLARTGWRGPVDTVAAALVGLRGPMDFFTVALDMTGEGPRLGLEIYPFEERDVWKRMIARLREQGRCLPAKGDSVLAWPGREILYASDGVFVARQMLSHVKLTIDDEGATQAKAYAWMSVLPVRP